MLRQVPTTVLLAIAFGGAAGVAVPAQAATITVDSLADGRVNDGACTLREAITNANADSTAGSADCAAGSGADTISFSVTGTIILTFGQLPPIAQNLTITGPGASLLTISGNNASRVLWVNAGVTFDLSGVTVANGSMSGSARCWGSVPPDEMVYGACGGGVFVDDGGSLTVTDSTFSDNGAGLRGGGIFTSYGGSLTVTNSTFSDNTADVGGGIYIAGRTTSAAITNSTFSFNLAAYGGGGIFNSDGLTTVTRSTFNGNWTATDGGGIANYIDGRLTVTNSTFWGNSAHNGGGIWNSTTVDGRLTVTNCIFSENTAIPFFGGGIYNHHFSSLTVTNSTFSRNLGQQGGGGIYNDSIYTLTVTNSTFHGNWAWEGGGGIHVTDNGIYQPLGHDRGEEQPRRELRGRGRQRRVQHRQRDVVHVRLGERLALQHRSAPAPACGQRRPDPDHGPAARLPCDRPDSDSLLHRPSEPGPEPAHDRPARPPPSRG